MRLTAPAINISLAGQLELLVDPAASLTFAEVLSADNSSSFKAIPGYLSRGYTQEASWVRLALSRSADGPETVYLWLGPVMLNEVDVYIQTGTDPRLASSYLTYALGDHTAQREKPMLHTGLTVPVALPSTDSYQIYIRVHTTSVHKLNGWVLSGDQLATKTATRVFGLGGYLAIILAICLVNLILAARLKEKIYAYYGVYLLTLVANQLGIEGFLTLLWPSSVHWLSDPIVGAGTGLGFVFFSLFCMQLFQSHETHRCGHRFLQFVVLVGLAATLTSTTIWYGQIAQFLFLVGLVLVIVMNIMALQLRRQGVVGANVFLLAFSFCSVGSVILFLQLLKVLPFNWFTEYAFHFGSFAHIILMTLALTERVLGAEKKALQASRNAENTAVELAHEMTHELNEKSLQLESALSAEKMIRANQSHFIDMISHEYRTPLAIIRANLDFLKLLEGDSDPQKKEILAKMTRAVQRSTEIFDVGAATGTIEQKLSLQNQTIPLRGFFTTIIDEARVLCGDFYRLTLSDQLPAVLQGDPRSLKTAFLNMLDNAVKYSPPGSMVDVGVVEDSGSLQISIMNSIRTDAIIDTARLFDKFYQGSDGHETRGSGVGLYLVRRIVEQQGGSVVVSVNATEFKGIVRLPLSEGIL
jgi:signal transduction histidine kinase